MAQWNEHLGPVAWRARSSTITWRGNSCEFVVVTVSMPVPTGSPHPPLVHSALKRVVQVLCPLSVPAGMCMCPVALEARLRLLSEAAPLGERALAPLRMGAARSSPEGHTVSGSWQWFCFHPRFLVMRMSSDDAKGL